MHCGNVPVENNANRFLFHKANCPIFINNGRIHHSAPASKRAVSSPMIRHHGGLFLSFSQSILSSFGIAEVT